MSRIGKLPVIVPQNVKVRIENNTLYVEGPKGKLQQSYNPDIEVRMEKGTCILDRKNELKKTKALHGLYRSLLQNMVTGVTTGFKKVLVINGVGYRAEMKGKELTLNMGYSAPVIYVGPPDVNIECETQNKIIVQGPSKEKVGQVAAEIRSIRPSEPYKGKGIKYENEYVRRKVGKSGVK
ncbi:MAG TPA: 50S ribosomal protein L6 [Spirochaetales bacterium]|nr:50S ribosomal protein L6 [Spirochaetales bacterium]HOV38320.1 50S ribosomal protein L6 [Spirochaetales bacterium]